MKRILHITSQYPGMTGSGIYLNELIREGNKRGYIQGLIAGLPRGEKLNLNVCRRHFYPVLFNTADLPFPIVGMSDEMPYESTKYSDMTDEMLNAWKKAFKKTVKKAVNEFKPDIIISHHLWLLTSLVKKTFPNIRTIAICHGTDIRQLIKCPQYKQYVLEGCGQVDIVLALNEKQKEDIHNLYLIPMKKIIIIGGGYNDDIFYPSPKRDYDRIKLVYAGKLSYSKGVLSLINAYNLLEDENIELLIAGRGVGREEKAIKEAGKNSRLPIKFLGQLTQRELAELFRQSHIFVLPSFYEGLSLVTLEALACGLIAVVNNLPGLKSFLGYDINNSGIIEYVNLPRMKYVDLPLEEELTDYEERLALGIKKQIHRIKSGFIVDESIREIIDKFSWNNVYNKIEKYF